MDKLWRPANWASIKRNILEETPVVFSPSTGYSKDQKDVIMEKVASAIVKELLDAGLIYSQEQTGKTVGKDEPAWFGDTTGKQPASPNQNSESN